ESVTYHRPSLGLVSNLSGKLVTDEVTEPSYWVRHVREAVRFADGVKALGEAGAGIFLDVGPRPVLLGMAAACLSAGARSTMIASLRAAREEPASLLDALGAYWSSGGSVDWSGVFPEGGRRVPLPTYAWQRQRYWVDVPARSTAGLRRGHAGGHPLLGEELSVSTQASMRIWETTLEHTRLPWLRDHRL